MPKILIFSLSYFPFIGGAEVAIKEITDRATDFEFDLITNRFDAKLPAEEKIGRVQVYRVGSGKWWEKYFYPWLAQKKARELVRGVAGHQNYAIVWGVLETWAGLAALKFKEKNPEVKYLLTMQSGDTDAFIRRRTWFWARRYAEIFKKADFIQVISEFLKKRARLYGFRGEIAVVPNGVDVEKVKSQKSKVKSCSELFFSCWPEIKRGEEKIIISVSRLEGKNGLEYLIRAVKDLPVKLLIVGSGKLEHRLKTLTAKLNINHKVIFAGKVDHKEVPRYLAVADIFVRPSLSEGLGNAFLEAMAAGLPVIGTRVGGIPDFLNDGETGLFCKVKDPADLAEKIKFLMENDKLQEKLIKNGKELVKKKYSWDNIAEQMQKIFKELTRC